MTRRGARLKVVRRLGDAEATRLELLKRRLDNVVFRLGFAPTVPAARQLVAYGHIRVNGRGVDRPAYLVKAGNEIAVATRTRRMPALIDAASRDPEVRMPGYLARSADDRLTGRVTGRPRRRDIPFAVDEAAIVELYAR
jgi:small subunit ribosomal protein S4